MRIKWKSFNNRNPIKIYGSITAVSLQTLFNKQWPQLTVFFFHSWSVETMSWDLCATSAQAVQMQVWSVRQ